MNKPSMRQVSFASAECAGKKRVTRREKFLGEMAGFRKMISVAVNQLSEVTQGNASNAESSAHAAVLLQAQAKDLHQLVAELQAIISGQ